MPHFYSEDQLSRKNRNQLWKICEELGCKRRRSKHDCIKSILNSQPQHIEPLDKDIAVIGYDDDSFEGLTQPYTITVNGLLINRTGTYAQAERFCNFQGYQIADLQEQAQSELADYIEQQAEEYQVDDYLFHHDVMRPCSTEAGNIYQHNGYFDLSSDISSLMSAFDQIVSHGQIVANISNDIDFKDDWKQKLIQAAELVDSVMMSAYAEGLAQSDKLFLNNCLSV